MRALRTFSDAVLMASLILAEVVAADEPTSFETQKLTDTVWVLETGGGNIGVSAGIDGVFIIDDNYEGDADAIRKTIAHISEKPVDFVINTHWHFDHAGSNKGFSAMGSLIVAHDNVRERLAAGNYLSIHAIDVPPAPPEALPVLTFNDTVTLHLNGESVDVIHVQAAHTDGDAIVRFRSSNVVHAGDVFLNGIYPFIDIDSGGTLTGSIAAVDALLSLIDERTVIIPGHGPVATQTDVADFREMFVAIGEAVSKMKASDLSVEEVLAAGPADAFDDRWNSWGDRWKRISLTSIYRSVP